MFCIFKIPAVPAIHRKEDSQSLLMRFQTETSGAWHLLLELPLYVQRFMCRYEAVHIVWCDKWKIGFGIKFFRNELHPFLCICNSFYSPMFGKCVTFVTFLSPLCGGTVRQHSWRNCTRRLRSHCVNTSGTQTLTATLSVFQWDSSLWGREINSLYNELSNFVTHLKGDGFLSMVYDDGLNFTSVTSVNHTSE